MKGKIINLFFDEDEMDLVDDYKKLVIIAIISFTVTVITIL